MQVLRHYGSACTVCVENDSVIAVYYILRWSYNHQQCWHYRIHFKQTAHYSMYLVSQQQKHQHTVSVNTPDTILVSLTFVSTLLVKTLHSESFLNTFNRGNRNMVLTIYPNHCMSGIWAQVPVTWWTQPGHQMLLPRCSYPQITVPMCPPLPPEASTCATYFIPPSCYPPYLFCALYQLVALDDQNIHFLPMHRPVPCTLYHLHLVLSPYFVRSTSW